jgi:murein DD-endopeptidase MepM/ murein hydrolase activator NlpD
MNSLSKVATILISFLIGFAAGAAVTVHFLDRYGHRTETSVSVMPAQPPQLQRYAWTQDRIDQLKPRMPQTEHPTEQIMDVQPGLIEDDDPSKHGAVRPIVPESPAMIADDVIELRQRHLLLPLSNLRKEDLRNSFDESRGKHIHEAIDILAPRNTAILAVEDGSIARLWQSVPGGITVYLFDPEQKYEYYYAHLERYADGLKDGDRMKRGQVIGYVGSSGNAPKDTPHLHFTIFKLTDQKRWWEGTAVNPYLVYKGR